MKNSSVTLRLLGGNLTFAFFRLGLAQRRWRRRRRLLGLHRGRRRRRGYRRHLGHHGFDGGGYVGGGQRCVGGGGSSQGVVGAELSPLGAEDHHHLGHGDLGVLGCDEGPGGGGEAAGMKRCLELSVSGTVCACANLTNWLKAL